MSTADSSRDTITLLDIPRNLILMLGSWLRHHTLLLVVVVSAAIAMKYGGYNPAVVLALVAGVMILLVGLFALFLGNGVTPGFTNATIVISSVLLTGIGVGLLLRAVSPALERIAIQVFNAILQFF